MQRLSRFSWDENILLEFFSIFCLFFTWLLLLVWDTRLFLYICQIDCILLVFLSANTKISFLHDVGDSTLARSYLNSSTHSFTCKSTIRVILRMNENQRNFEFSKKNFVAKVNKSTGRWYQVLQQFLTEVRLSGNNRHRPGIIVSLVIPKNMFIHLSANIRVSLKSSFDEARQRWSSKIQALLHCYRNAINEDLLSEMLYGTAETEENMLSLEYVALPLKIHTNRIGSVEFPYRPKHVRAIQRKQNRSNVVHIPVFIVLCMSKIYSLPFYSCHMIQVAVCLNCF